MLRKRTTKLKRTVSGILALTMTASVMPSINVFADVQAGSSKTYVGDGYSIRYDVTSVWDGNSNVTVTLTNTGEENIRNWALSYDTDGDIKNIWNGVILEDNDFTIIKNNEYNYEVKPDDSVSFGYTAVGANELPEAIVLSSETKDYEANDYAVTLNIENDWGTGFTGNIAIEAIGDEPIEAWKMSFDTNFELSSVWNSAIVESNENSYTVESAYATAFIKPGETRSFGISGTKETGTTPEISNISLSGVVVDADAEAHNVSDSSESSETDSSSTSESSSKTDLSSGADSSSKPDDSSNSENDSEIDMTDTDKDGLPDFYEKMLGTDIEEPDTDHDGLTDYQEVCISGTDPLVFDSVTKDVADAEADIDKDGLSNITEIGLGTNLRDDDTDDDDLSDGDEVNVYGTDPLEPDTDKDGLDDGSEVNKFGTDPLSADSDGNGVADGDEKRLQTFTHEAENKESAVTEVSVTIEATGDLDKTMHIESIMDKDVMCSEVVGLVGEPFSIETTSQFDKATITYKVDKSKLGETKFDDLLFLWYDRENDNFVELDTIHDEANSTVSVETTHFSEYMITDGEAWIRNWQEIENLLRPFYDRRKLPSAPTVRLNFTACDVLDNNDPRNVDAVEKIYTTLRKNDCHLDFNYYAGYFWSGGGYTLAGHDLPLEDYISYAKSNYRSKNGLVYKETIPFNIGAFLLLGFFELDQNQVIQCISVIKDDYLYDDSTLKDLEYNTRKDYNIQYVVDLRPEYDDYLASLCEHSGGKYIQYSEDALDELLKLIVLRQQGNNLQDYDTDGFTDIEETNGWLFKSNGAGISTDPENDDTDGDNLKDNEEMEIAIKPKPVEINGEVYKYYHVMHSNPDDDDTDDDGLTDDMDAEPRNIFNENFQLINDYNMDCMELYPDAYRVKYNRYSALYNTGSFSNEIEKLKYEAIWSKVYALATGGKTIISSTLVEDIKTLGATPNASKALLHFLNNQGSLYYIENLSYAIAQTRQMRKSYYNLLNDYMNLIENTAVEGHTYLFSTVPNSGYGVSYENVRENIAETDWWLTLGDALTGLISEVECYEDNNMTYYKANIKFCVFDCYKWSGDSSEEDLYNLNYYGLASIFKDYGVYETSIIWKKGARYPSVENNNEINISNFEFSGITDTNLTTAYINSSMYYNILYQYIQMSDINYWSWWWLD